ncbi:unnamed protein product [Leptosia nina]|uniref:Programmed cell death protein 7 n=1 Tax=Leptosia nina TaxID=320188 RepID=A0AAV1J2G2_9NEOP
MAYNQNFYNNFHGNNFTFQYPYPPPPPPAHSFFSTPQLSDQDFLKKFERFSSEKQNEKKTVTITVLKAKLSELLKTYNEISEEFSRLSENIDNHSDTEWEAALKIMSYKKERISKLLTEFSASYMEHARKYLAKRTAKRMRLQRLKEERKQQRLQQEKDMKERSRKIDENLQKIKDDILKAKKEEEAKLEADMVLKDVHRKKIDAKKCLSKLEALLKLRQARLNTAKGRGQNVSESDSAMFQKNIEKLKSSWTERLEMYNKEENNLRARLAIVEEVPLNQAEIDVDNNLIQWKEVLFGGENPQVDFKGDIDRFVNVRRQWDDYVDEGGSPIPVGWVL